MKRSNIDKDVKHYSIMSNAMYFAKLLKKEEPTVLWLCLIEIVLGAIVPLFGIYLPKIVVDLLIEGVTIQRMIIVIGGLTILMIMVYGLREGAIGGKYDLYNTQRFYVIGQLFLKTLRVKYENTESGEAQKSYWKAIGAMTNGDGSALSLMVTSFCGLIINVLCFILYSTVMSFLSMWMVIVLIGFSIVDYGINLKRIRFIESLRDEEAIANKHSNCIKGSMDNYRAAKDIRVFSMRTWLIQLRDKTLDEIDNINQKHGFKIAGYEKITYSLTLLRDILAYLYLIYMAVNGEISVSEFVLYVGAIRGFSGFVQNIMRDLSSIRAASNSTDYVRAYIELEDEEREIGERHINELSKPVSIEFKNVSFKYSDSGEWILSDFNLMIQPGEKLAIVGVNGAGKTTIIKLLCGMYEPNKGQILINNIDYGKFPKKELYQLFSVVFQEPLILPFTVGQNLTMCMDNLRDDEKAWDVLDKAGLGKIFRERNISLDSYMMKFMEKQGIELSGGQQQRFLLARALYKDAPVLVLDEPTAALDPIAESEIYDSYNLYSNQKTSIFISHRLASTRFADRIIMIDNGKIIEEGTHSELMAIDGEYAKMFMIQSQYYNDKGR